MEAVETRVKAATVSESAVSHRRWWKSRNVRRENRIPKRRIVMFSRVRIAKS